MKISWAITVCNEEIELQKLVTFLLKHKELQDEIVITYDYREAKRSVVFLEPIVLPKEFREGLSENQLRDNSM